MARNDGVDRTTVRNVNLKNAQIANTQRHNEREKGSYTNQDIVPERTPLNVHFKEPAAGYVEMFAQLEQDGVISTRGLKEDAAHFGELIFDVNSAYFHNHGGYEFARQFYEEAYKAAVEIVGGEQYILSAVMHADERNRAMSEALGQDVYHYHLHVVYVPVVEKQILWSKRCKDKALIRTVKETIMQVSSSKKWMSKPALDEQGKPILQKNGKPVLKKSYSVLQDDFFKAMRAAGYDDVERGERGSGEEHLTVTQFKVEREKERLEQVAAQVEEQEDILDSINQKVEKKEQRLAQVQEQLIVKKELAVTFAEIDGIGHKTLLGHGKVEMTERECNRLKRMAKHSLTVDAEVASLKDELAVAKREALTWRQRYEQLKEQTKEYLEAVRKVPQRMKEFIRNVLSNAVPAEKASIARTARGPGRHPQWDNQDQIMM